MPASYAMGMVMHVHTIVASPTVNDECILYYIYTTEIKNMKSIHMDIDSFMDTEGLFKLSTKSHSEQTMHNFVEHAVHQFCDVYDVRTTLCMALHGIFFHRHRLSVGTVQSLTRFRSVLKSHLFAIFSIG